MAVTMRPAAKARTVISPAASHASGPQAGVTLVEVLAVLVIIALVTSLTVPRILASSSARNMDRVTEQLVADLQRGNIKARAQASPVIVEVFEGGYRIQAISVRREWGPDIRSSWQQRRLYTWQDVSRVELSGRTLGREEVRIRLRRDSQLRDITVEPLTGRVTLVED